MKKYLGLIVLTSLLSYGASAKSSLEKVLTKISTQAEEISGSDLEHYWIAVHATPASARAVGLTECKSPKAYKKTSSKKIAEETVTIVADGVSRMLDQEIIDMDDGYYSKMELLSSLRDDLREALGRSEITVCKQLSTPAYSDGHEITFVKVDGKLSFAFEVGSPD